MAPVNPQVPQVSDPFYLHLSRPAQEPTPDKSGGTLFKTIGTALEDTGKLVDTGIKGYIKDDITKQMTSIDEENISGLESTKAAIEGGTQVAQNTQGNQPNDVLTAQGSAAVPSDIHQGINAVQMLQDVRNNGKITESYKLGRQYQILKDTRAQWPMYRDYIDKESEKITGKNIANAYANSLIGDLNAANAGKQKQHDELLSTLEQEIRSGNEQAAFLKNRLIRGEISDDEGRVSAARLNAYKYNYTVDQQQNQRKEWTIKDEKEAAPDLADKLLHKSSDTYAHSISQPEASDTVLKSLQNATLTPEQAQVALQKIQLLKNAAKTSMERDINDPKSGINGKSLFTILGPTDAKARIDSKLEYFDRISDLLSNGQYGQIHSATNAYNAITSTSKLSLMNDATMGGFFRTQSALVAVGGDPFAKEVSQYFINKNLGGSPGVKTWLEDFAGKQMTGTSTTNMKGGVDQVNAAKDIPAATKAKTIDEMIHNVERISDPKTPDNVKVNLIRDAYSSQNLGLVSKFEKENGSNLSVFGRMTSPDMAKEIWRLGGQSINNPLWQNYRSWATQSFGQEIFAGELRQLSAAQAGLAGTPHFERGGIGGTGQGSIGWDTVNHRLVADFPNISAFDSIRKNVNRINYGLHNIKSIAETEGTDINSYMLGELQRFGAVNPEVMKGLPQQMYDSIAKQKQNEDAFKAAVKEKYKKREDTGETPSPKPSTPTRKLDSNPTPTSSDLKRHADEDVEEIANKYKLTPELKEALRQRAYDARGIK